MPLYVPSSSSALTWTTFTPTLGATISNPTLGSGAVSAGRYIQIGKLIHFEVDIAFGTGMTAGNGTYVILLPASISASVTNNNVVGTGRLYDSSTNTSAIISAFGFNTDHSRIQMLVNGAAGNVTAIAPWTWAVGDEIRVVGTYESV